MVARGFDMQMLRRRKRSEQRSCTARINRNIRAPGQLADPARIALGLGKRQVPSDCDNADNLKFLRRCQRQQDGDRIVQAGISVDDDPPHYILYSPSAASKLWVPKASRPS